MTADRETLRAYRDRAQDYAEKYARGEADRHLKAFIDELPVGGTVLDFGCGPGSSTAAMIGAGLKAEGLDASPEFAEIAKEKFGVNVAVAEFDSLSEEEKYDGVYANFSLLHAPKAEMPAHLRRISRALRAGGKFHIGLKTGEGEHRDRLGRLYAYYTDTEITGLLNDAGFIVLTRDFGSDAGLEGTVSPWIILLTRKSS